MVAQILGQILLSIPSWFSYSTGHIYLR